MSDSNTTRIFIGFFGAFHAALKDKVKEIKVEQFNERTLKNSGVTYCSLQIEYPKPRGIGHTARQKRRAKRRKNKR